MGARAALHGPDVGNGRPTVQPASLAGPRSGRSREAATELAPSRQEPEDIRARHRLEAARAVLRPDQEHDALPVDQAMIKISVRVMVGSPACLAALPTPPISTMRKSSPRMRASVERKRRFEAAVMEFAHAAGDLVEPRFERRRHVAARIAVDGAAIAGPVRAVAKNERKDATILHARQARIEQDGVAAIGHETLEHEFFAGWKLAVVVAQRRGVREMAHAAADVGPRDQRKFQTGIA